MSNNQGGIACAVWCCGISLVGGVLAAALLMVLGGWSFLQGVFGGFFLFLVAAALLSWIMCRPLPAASAAGAGSADGGSTSAGGVAASATGGAAATTAASAAEASSDQASDGGADSGGAEAAQAAEASAETAGGTDTGGGPTAEGVKPSTALAGEAELAERKGEWRYDGGDEKASGGGAGAQASSDSSAASVETESAAADYDNDGVLEGSDEGTKPEMLSGPRDGGADNLKEIKGIGPKLEQLVNSMGVYHFDQIANWTPDEVAWVNANLTGFKGRVTRDNWIDQAKILAAGGETEFSKKVEKGGVYDE